MKIEDYIAQRRAQITKFEMFENEQELFAKNNYALNYMKSTSQADMIEDIKKDGHVFSDIDSKLFKRNK